MAAPPPPPPVGALKAPSLPKASSAAGKGQAEAAGMSFTDLLKSKTTEVVRWGWGPGLVAGVGCAGG